MWYAARGFGEITDISIINISDSKAIYEKAEMGQNLTWKGNGSPVKKTQSF